MTPIKLTRRQPQELAAHPHADRIPVMPEPEYAVFRADIAARGIQVPIEITIEDVVLDGRQRLRAADELELERVPVRVIEAEDELDYMFRAAILRRQLTASQRVALVVEREEYLELEAGARTRQRANLVQATEGATLPPRGKTRELGARMAGAGARTVQDVVTVRKHDPELFERIKQGLVSAPLAARQVRRMLRDQALPPAPPLPEGPFELIYADPPWQLGNPDGEKAPENHYSTLALAELVALRPPAALDAILYVWAVNMLLPEALQLIEAWGFRSVANLAWVKPSIGLGNWTRNRHELLLVGRRGALSPPEPDLRPGSVIEAPRRRHAQKPAGVYELLERAHPAASKLELFARSARPGRTAWGNEAAR